MTENKKREIEILAEIRILRQAEIGACLHEITQAGRKYIKKLINNLKNELQRIQDGR